MDQPFNNSLVTCEQFAQFVRSEEYFRLDYWNPYVHQRFWNANAGRPGFGGDEVLRRIEFRWQARRLPVTRVSWFEADAYCKFAGGRLPWSWEFEGAGRKVEFDARQLEASQSNSRVPEWCGDWFNSKGQGTKVTPEHPLRCRVANWPESRNAVPDLISGPIAFRVVRA